MSNGSDDKQNNSQQDGQKNEAGKRVDLARVYVKDISFESPQSPKIFSENIHPEIRLQVGSQIRPLDNNLFDVTLEITAEAKKDNDTVFIIEIEHAGIFQVHGFGDAELEQVLNIYCPATLFPYTRQAIDQLLTLGGFPALHLAPINFEHMYAQRKAKPKS